MVFSHEALCCDFVSSVEVFRAALIGQLKEKLADLENDDDEWFKDCEVLEKSAATEAKLSSWEDISRQEYFKIARRRGCSVKQMEVRHRLLNHFKFGFVRCEHCGVESFNTSKFPASDYPELFDELKCLGFMYFHVDTCSCNLLYRRKSIGGICLVLSGDSRIETKIQNLFELAQRKHHWIGQQTDFLRLSGTWAKAY